MKQTWSAVPAVALLLALGGCGESDRAPGPGGVTRGEARALEDAEAMLDERRPQASSAP